MPFEQRDNSGSLFKNDRKDKETQPDYKGAAMIDGILMDIGAWVKESKTGTKYISLSFKAKDEAPKAAPAGFHGAKPQQDDGFLPF